MTHDNEKFRGRNNIREFQRLRIKKPTVTSLSRLFKLRDFGEKSQFQIFDSEILSFKFRHTTRKTATVLSSAGDANRWYELFCILSESMHNV